MKNKPEAVSPNKHKSDGISSPSSHEKRQESEIHSVVIGSEYLDFLTENYAKLLKKALVDITGKRAPLMQLRLSTEISLFEAQLQVNRRLSESNEL